jgi:hypothetical protein
MKYFSFTGMASLDAMLNTFKSCGKTITDIVVGKCVNKYLYNMLAPFSTPVTSKITIEALSGIPTRNVFFEKCYTWGEDTIKVAYAANADEIILLTDDPTLYAIGTINQ